MAAADLNSDGRLDHIVRGLFKDVTLLPGNGDGTFQAGVAFNAGESPRDVAVADVDGDRRSDLIVANGDVGHPTSAKNYASVLLNKVHVAAAVGSETLNCALRNDIVN